MKPAERHLGDDQMIAVVVGADSRLRRPDAALAHLETCTACTSRYHELARQLTDWRDEAQAEADAIFTPARLESQRAQILARLEYAGHPARVIKFPARGNQSLAIFTGTQVRRWIAAAAAAGLIIGVAAGRMVDFHPAAPQPGVRATATAPTAAPRVRDTERTGVKPGTDDQEILLNLDRPLYLQPVAELEALDAMTPKPREVALKLR
ncbi:MAG: hypothetical protein ACM3NQ_18740 [Bacteroidales bacterium]